VPQRPVEDWFRDLTKKVPSVKAKASKSLIFLVCWTIWCK
jgi:hypothetical protein